AMAMSPIESVFAYRSKTGCQVVPLFVLRKTPPDAVPTKMMRGSLGTASMSSTRPPNAAGPMWRQLVSFGHCCAIRTGGSFRRTLGRPAWPESACAATRHEPAANALTPRIRTAVGATAGRVAEAGLTRRCGPTRGRRGEKEEGMTTKRNMVYHLGVRNEPDGSDASTAGLNPR